MTSIFDEGVAFRTAFRAKGLHFCRLLVSPHPANRPTSLAPSQAAAQSLVEIEHMLECLLLKIAVGGQVHF